MKWNVIQFSMFKTKITTAVADPGFPEGMEMKEIGPRGKEHVPSTTLHPPLNGTISITHGQCFFV